MRGRPLLGQTEYLYTAGFTAADFGFVLGRSLSALLDLFVLGVLLRLLFSGAAGRFCLAVLNGFRAMVFGTTWWLYYVCVTWPGFLLAAFWFVVFDYVMVVVGWAEVVCMYLTDNVPVVGPVLGYVTLVLIPTSPWLRGDFISLWAVQDTSPLGGYVSYERSYTNKAGAASTRRVQEPEVMIGGLSTSVHLGGVTRLRRRAVWVRRLETVIGSPPETLGRILRGRWTPDLPLPGDSLGAQLVKIQSKDGVKLLGGGAVRGGDKENDMVVYYIVERSDGSTELIAPELMSHLASYSFLRERSADLVSALRLRALEWCKGQGLSRSATWALVPGSFGAAWEVSTREERARKLLGDGEVLPLWWSSA